VEVIKWLELKKAAKLLLRQIKNATAQIFTQKSVLRVVKKVELAVSMQTVSSLEKLAQLAVGLADAVKLRKLRSSY
jgi:hypothetical protein